MTVGGARTAAVAISGETPFVEVAGSHLAGGATFHFCDEALPQLESLLDPAAALAFCLEQGVWDGESPNALTPFDLRYESQRRAVISYFVDWGERYWIGNDQFSIEITAGEADLEI